MFFDERMHHATASVTVTVNLGDCKRKIREQVA